MSYYKSAISLPIHYNLTKKQQLYVINEIKNFHKMKKKLIKFFMNQYFKKFLKINKKIYKEYDKSDKYIFVIDRGRFPHAFQLAVAASALNKKYKSNVLIFSEKKRF